MEGCLEWLAGGSVGSEDRLWRTGGSHARAAAATDEHLEVERTMYSHYVEHGRVEVTDEMSQLHPLTFLSAADEQLIVVGLDDRIHAKDGRDDLRSPCCVIS